MQRSGWTRDVDNFLQWLSAIPFSGGGFNDAAIAEGLSEALMVCSLVFDTVLLVLIFQFIIWLSICVTLPLHSFLIILSLSLHPPPSPSPSPLY